MQRGRSVDIDLGLGKRCGVYRRAQSGRPYSFPPIKRLGQEKGAPIERKLKRDDCLSNLPKRGQSRRRIVPSNQRKTRKRHGERKEEKVTKETKEDRGPKGIEGGIDNLDGLDYKHGNPEDLKDTIE